jgi:hypothetical protein
MGFRYMLKLPDGTDAREVEYADTTVEAGDKIVVDSNRTLHMLAVISISVELAGEFVDRPLHWVLEAELVGRFVFGGSA